MRRLLLALVAVLLIICLVVGVNRYPKNSLQEIEPSRSFRFGVASSSSKCNGRVPEVTLPKSSLTPAELALIVNDQDPQSVAVANYYQRRRNIPSKNVIHISLQPGIDDIDPAVFQPIKLKIDAAPSSKQAIALSFSQPFRVGCMSITSALSLGYNERFCQQQGTNSCRYPSAIPYYDSESVTPFADLGIRPSMILAGEDVAPVTQLIDRGAASDETFPQAMGYLLTTTDRDRSVRFGKFSVLKKTWNANSGWIIQHLNNRLGKASSDFITHKHDILFYFTGLANVPQIQTNSYLPGAIADHLTSSGGVLFNSPQMSILNWLKAGATASYGTVVEPCNLTAKFPDPEILVRHYYQGETAIEAYWKSVASPQEGVFVGDPLAKPMGVKRTIRQDQLSLKLSTLDPWKTYQVLAADSLNGTYLPVSELITLSNYQVVQMSFGCDKLYYKLIEVQNR